LPQYKGAEREQPAERGKRLLGVVVVYGAAEAEIESGHDKQNRHGRGELEQDRDAADDRRHAERESVEQAHHHPHVWKQRLEIAARDMAEIFEQHRATADFVSASPGARQHLAGFGRRHAVRLGRDHQHHVVIDLDLERTPAQAEPDGNVDGLLVMTAPEHADIAIVSDRRLDLHAHQRMLTKRPGDLVVRDFDKVGFRNDADKFFA